MDVIRKDAGRKRMIRRIVYISIVVITVPLITWALSRLKPAAPSVEAATLWPDTVKRGQMKVDRRGLGTLVPEETLFIPAISDGRVEKRLVQQGDRVKPDTILFVLSNPELENSMVDAEYQLKTAEATYTDTQMTLEKQGLDQQATAATVNADFKQAQLQSDRDKELAKEGLIPDLQEKLSSVKADELAQRSKLEQERLSFSKQQVQAQLAAQRAKIDQLRAMFELKKRQVEALKIRAGIDGIITELLVQYGQRVPAGTPLAKATQPWRLKAELKIAETQAKDILIGQNAEIDTRNGIIPGKVSRIDPAVINGTRTVDVRLIGPLPPGAVPDLSVDGTIEIENLKDVVYMGRPVFGQPNSTIQIFKIDPDGKGASRVPVKLGRTSVNTIEVLDGLKVGDRVILSDMSAMDGHDRIRLN
ncbi:MAG TPA: HlyD family efflux transporter periplasmic adaptor subunit [Bryobacteraceae bacterium]|nr:HlyD family efflux transporter periplasmic adaptor subunit [Bryobacteraceae bacterium]